MPMQINIHTKVNSKTIRREKHNNRDHIVLPSYTLPANVVMNGGLYTSAEIDAHYQKLDGTLAPLGHPRLDGEWVSAFSPDAINAYHVGAWNRNVKKSGNRVYVEKWLDVEVAKSSEGGRALLERVAAIERGEDVPPIHTSVAVFADQEPAPADAKGYEWVAKIHGIDHDAILLNEVGAATPEQGVGLMVNADLAKPALVPNAGALGDDSFMDKWQKLGDAAAARFVIDPNRDWANVEDFSSDSVIIARSGGESEIFGYKMESGRVVLGDSGIPVKRQRTWVVKVNKLWRNLFGAKAPQINVDEKETEMAFSDEDKTALAAIVNGAVATAVKPLQDQVTALQANQEKIGTTIAANAEAALADKRAKVKAKFGDVVANTATAEALDALVAQCGEAAPLLPNGNAKKPEEDFTSAID